jgi:hypothetical protein
VQKTLRLTGLGLLALVLGSLIYVVVRPEGSSHLSRFVYIDLPLSLRGLPFINNLPSFFHVLGFSLLTISVVNERRYVLASCLFWLAINVLFEFGQHPYFVQWLDTHEIEIIPAVNTYMRLGTFDIWDMSLSMLGALTAYGISLVCLKNLSLKNSSLENSHSIDTKRMEL